MVDSLFYHKELAHGYHQVLLMVQQKVLMVKKKLKCSLITGSMRKFLRYHKHVPHGQKCSFRFLMQYLNMLRYRRQYMWNMLLVPKGTSHRPNIFSELHYKFDILNFQTKRNVLVVPLATPLGPKLFLDHLVLKMHFVAMFSWLKFDFQSSL